MTDDRTHRDESFQPGARCWLRKAAGLRFNPINKRNGRDAAVPEIILIRFPELIPSGILALKVVTKPKSVSVLWCVCSIWGEQAYRLAKWVVRSA